VANYYVYLYQKEKKERPTEKQGHKNPLSPRSEKERGRGKTLPLLRLERRKVRIPRKKRKKR